MPETIIESVLNNKLNHEVLIKWLNNEIEEDAPGLEALLLCSKTEFVAYFLSYLRSQTESTLQTNTTALNLIQHQNTPEKLLNSNRKHQRSTSEPTVDSEKTKGSDGGPTKPERYRSHLSPNRDRSAQKRGQRRVKTKLVYCTKDVSTSKTDSDESNVNSSIDRIAISSTPLKNGMKASEYSSLSLTSPVTPHSRSAGYERCDTPRSYRHSKSHDKSNSFGDYLASAQTSKSAKKKWSTPKNISSESDDKSQLDFSNSDMFPEIGARKSSSLKGERRRINPTNLSSTPQKSISLNSFTSDQFQQPSLLALQDNVLFKQQKIQPLELSNTFDAERSILKQEREKLMEKFNILNTSNKPTTSQIKVIPKEVSDLEQNYIKLDSTKVIFKEKIDLLIEIYRHLFKNNLILSINGEIIFLISILLSEQYEKDYINAETNLNANQIYEFLLKSINNSTYFAVKSLWHQRNMLEFIFTKNSLKKLGENKKVRSFSPDLAKHLLNLYGIKCEIELNKDESKSETDERQNVIVNFNFEMDNSDNFPSLLSFQNFKKQRDMFYEIIRWYNETNQQPARTTFRTRVKTLLSLAISTANHSHLARLFTAHMVAECLVEGGESKLSKLQRRLTGSTPHDSNSPNVFSSREMFYKDFIMFAENESFRVHLRDTIASELIIINNTATFTSDEKASKELSKDYLQILKKSKLLSKFLGYMTSLPYTQIPVEFTIKTGAIKSCTQKDVVLMPKDKVFENDLAVRNHIQPTIDLTSILKESIKKNRIVISIPWISQFLSMMDYTSLRILYYQTLLKYIYKIYKERLNDESIYKKNTIIFLKLTLGSLFDSPQFPQNSYYENSSIDVRIDSSITDENIDSLELIDESIILELCPFLKDINALLVSSKPIQEKVGSFRHITPVTMSLNQEQRNKNKEKDIQARLDEQYLKSLTSSTRRVLELIIDRVSYTCIKRYMHSGTSLQSAISQAEAMARARGAAAVLALLGAERADRGERGVGGAAIAVVARGAGGRVRQYLEQHWVAELSKREVDSKAILTDTAEKTDSDVVRSMLLPEEQFQMVNVSPSAVIIEIKEQISRLLEYSQDSNLVPTLTNCAIACKTDNVFTRAPTLRALGQLTHDLCVVYVSRKPLQVMSDLMPYLHAIWNECCPNRRKLHDDCVQESAGVQRDLSPELRNFDEDDRCPTPISDDENIGPKPLIINVINSSIDIENDTNISISKSPKSNHQSPTQLNYQNNKPKSPQSKFSFQIVNPISPKISTKSPTSAKSPTLVSKSTTQFEESDFLEYFDRVLCPRNIMILSNSKVNSADIWKAMAEVLIFMLKQNYLSEDSMIEQCLALYRQDWDQDVLKNVSSCVRMVCERCPKTKNGKFTLFLQFLSEYCENMAFD